MARTASVSIGEELNKVAFEERRLTSNEFQAASHGVPAVAVQSQGQVLQPAIPAQKLSKGKDFFSFEASRH